MDQKPGAGQEHFRKLSEDFEKLSEDFRKLTEDFEKLSEDFQKLSEDFGKLSKDFRKLSEDFGKLSKDFWKTPADFQKTTDYFVAVPMDRRKTRGDLHCRPAFDTASRRLCQKVNQARETRKTARRKRHRSPVFALYDFHSRTASTVRTPTAFHLSAQGCEERATLGPRLKSEPTLKGLNPSCEVCRR